MRRQPGPTLIPTVRTTVGLSASIPCDLFPPLRGSDAWRCLEASALDLRRYAFPAPTAAVRTWMLTLPNPWSARPAGPTSRAVLTKLWARAGSYG